MRVDPVRHYIVDGAGQGRDPSPSFNTHAYLSQNSDIASAGENPLVHYLRANATPSGVDPALAGDGEAGVVFSKDNVDVAKIEDLIAVGTALANELHESYAHPWRPVLEGLQRVGLRALLAVDGLLSDRTTKRFRRSLEKRRSGRFVRQWTNACRLVLRSGSAPTIRRLDRDAWLARTFRIVPFYLNPHLRQDPAVPPLKLAVHLHLYYEDMTERCIAYIRNIPVRFDLYVSVPEGRDTLSLTRKLVAALPEAEKVQVEEVPNRGRDIGPLVVQFGARLLRYDVVAHFHTKRSPHKGSLAPWFDAIMTSLCGSRSEVMQILDLLARDAKVVYPAGNKIPVGDTGWSDDFALAKQILKGQNIDIAHYPFVEFPQGMMFWARTGSMTRLLQLPLSFENFPEEPIAPDGTLAHALERLVLVLAQIEPGRNYRLEAADLSLDTGEYFETQHDFARNIVHDTVKVLAYYLPQFHSTPENDAWHGKGFTEWHKVRAAYPLFQGHYQQHVPHPDIGYYHLDKPAQLRKQAEMMRKGGVHGMIFYHYWFSGRLILEEPARMLLDHPEIEMPFCFCWANENWTRRWDGNEAEILLEQVYSPQDAVAFIRYLIPFFRDERYIRIEGRPVLFVYRPASIQGVRDYVDAWARECEAVDLPAPFLVAVLTRGATSPHDHCMDAGAERVLHDWLGSAARDIRGELHPYWPLNGSVLDYRDVVEHYTGKTPARDFQLFRSLVPVWDNTARYASEALMLHDFTTEAMQRWVEKLIRDAEEHLPRDRRFVLVNAWNEWAEGAHLEPDMRFGYGYLNAIGRAMCGYAFHALEYVRIEPETTIALRLGPRARQRMRDEKEARRKFVHCIASTPMFGRCVLRVVDEPLATELRERGLECECGNAQEADFILVFDDLFLFPETSVERMVQMALRHQGHAVCASPRNDPGFLHDPLAPAGQIPYSGRTGMELLPRSEPRGYKICADAPAFRIGEQSPGATSRVSTVVRYHGKHDRRLLMNAMLSLLSQGGCRVRACVGVQDAPEPAASELQRTLEALPWAEGCKPLIRFFRSTPEAPDLRSLMLNEMLREAATDHVAFLDFDDILFPNAYETLLSRLRQTGKNATFARVYSTALDPCRGFVLRRDVVYNYGRSYEDFLNVNHAPLHSFMLDTRGVDLDAIHYFPDMRFLEDYYLTLQLFTRAGTDWDSLAQLTYIGDYIHFCDGTNTLAITNPETHRATLLRADYQLSETRIKELKERLVAKLMKTDNVSA
ncbi:glycoside hydrolase family 99-like domain-containing protein [Rhodoplanes serenus]|nr:glycoside hydrolase family 99-like domain-containing protein [Rhodoplanes serenus]